MMSHRHWRGRDPPARTRSFALVRSDPDAPRGTGDQRLRATRLGRPLPSEGTRPAPLRFHLMALDIPSLALPEQVRCCEVERAAADHILGESVLTATYSR